MLDVQRPAFGFGDRRFDFAITRRAGCIVVGCRFDRDGSDPGGFVQITVMVVEHTAKCIAAVAQKMPPIRHLDGLWCSLAGSIGIGAGAIAHDDFNGRMVLQPGGQGLSPAVGQQVDDPVTLQVAQDRAVALVLAPGPVINTQDTGRRQGLQCTCS